MTSVSHSENSAPDPVPIGPVTVVGSGVLGAQIAFQTAYFGHDVTVYDVDAAALEKADARFDQLVGTYRDFFTGREPGDADAARRRLTGTTDLEAAARGADLVIEAVPEKLDLKRDVLHRLGEAAAEHTILATNSSTLLPSDLADATGRPDRFLALHFANQVWRFNTAEVMGTDRTSPEVVDRVIAFAKGIGMVPVPLKKEKAGYVLNSLLAPFLGAALELVAGGYATPEVVDTTWCTATGAPMGPMRIYDVIGLETPYNILAAGGEKERAGAAWLKREYLDKGWLGRASGRGFYTYDS